MHSQVHCTDTAGGGGDRGRGVVNSANQNSRCDPRPAPSIESDTHPSRGRKDTSTVRTDPRREEEKKEEKEERRLLSNREASSADAGRSPRDVNCNGCKDSLKQDPQICHAHDRNGDGRFHDVRDRAENNQRFLYNTGFKRSVSAVLQYLRREYTDEHKAKVEGSCKENHPANARIHAHDAHINIAEKRGSNGNEAEQLDKEDGYATNNECTTDHHNDINNDNDGTDTKTKDSDGDENEDRTNDIDHTIDMHGGSRKVKGRMKGKMMRGKSKGKGSGRRKGRGKGKGKGKQKGKERAKPSYSECYPLKEGADTRMLQEEVREQHTNHSSEPITYHRVDILHIKVRVPCGVKNIMTFYYEVNDLGALSLMCCHTLN